MDHDRYQHLTSELVAWARRDLAVVGLVAVGSTAAVGREPDAWSDHDLLVVTVDGAAEQVRSDPHWLPDRQRIVLRFPEPDHGLTVIYDDGHLVELAVAETDDLAWLTTPDRRVLVGGAELERRLPAPVADPPDGDDLRDFQLLVKELVVAVARLGRAERISAQLRIVGGALPLLLDLVARLMAPHRPEAVDLLDPARRLEVTHPEVARRLAPVLGGRLDEVVVALVELAEDELVGRIDGARTPPLDAVRHLLARATGQGV